MNNAKEDLKVWFKERLKNVNHMDESDYETHIEYLKCDSIGKEEIDPVQMKL